MKRKFLALMLSALFLVSCSSPKKEDTSKTNVSEKKEDIKKEEKKEVKEIKIGDVISIKDKFEITINKIEFSKDVNPDVKTEFYNHYPAEDGKIIIHVDTDVKNLNKQDLEVDKILNLTADYNNGYTYNFFPIVENENYGFEDGFISKINPLSTLGVRYLCDCPEEVEKSENPVILKFNINGVEYTYKVK